MATPRTPDRRKALSKVGVSVVEPKAKQKLFDEPAPAPKTSTPVTQRKIPESRTTAHRAVQVIIKL